MMMSPTTAILFWMKTRPIWTNMPPPWVDSPPSGTATSSIGVMASPMPRPSGSRVLAASVPKTGSSWISVMPPPSRT